MFYKIKNGMINLNKVSAITLSEGWGSGYFINFEFFVGDENSCICEMYDTEELRDKDYEKILSQVSKYNKIKYS